LVAERLNSPLQVNRVVGAVLDKGSFGFGVPVGGVLTELRKIYPKSTLESCKKFAPTSTFTKQLQDCLHSDEWKRMDMMRNLLVHRIVPGRTIRLSTHRDLPDSIDLDQWFEGDVTRIYGGVGLPEPKWTFELDANCLVRQRDWIDKSIDGISERLTELAKDNGLG
jgi:hypothetical protein